MPEYSTSLEWTGGHRGLLRCSNGAEMPFSAPESLHGEGGVLTPEDAFVGALNTCYALMFIWAAEKLKIDLVSYTCEAAGRVEEYLDRTSTFSEVTMRPRVVARGASEDRVRRALQMAEKYSLVWQSVKARVSLEPVIIIAA
ncbi:osmotically inducible protein OsmC [Candidatus Bathyarchaeota archaeon RBG_13_60_20]|nr:MAG: osmotically inducible protein OsmC [Candidatus Bathyarchaeota archaeon RBG_13_60_20]